MQKRKSLIVGINSFLAKTIYERVNATDEVFAVYHTKKPQFSDTLDCIQVGDIESWRSIKFDIIFFIAAFIPNKDDNTNDKSIDERIYESNIALPQKLSKMFPEARIIFASSVSVFENYTKNVPITINTEPKPQSNYALSKLKGEQIIEKHSSFCIFRISSMYGEGMNLNTFLPRIIVDAIDKNKISLYGNGERKQNYIEVTTVADLMIQAANKKENGKYLAVSSNHYSNKEIAEIIQMQLSTEIEFKGIDHSKSYLYDNKETIFAFKLKEKSIKKGIEELIKWIKKTY